MTKNQTLSTSKDLLAAIYEQNITQQESITSLQKDMSIVKDQVKFTNGKVAGLMEDKIRRDEREVMSKELKSAAALPSIQAETVVLQQKWFQNEKLVGGVVAVLLAIAGVIGYLGGTLK
jgi:hypothetical protein